MGKPGTVIVGFGNPFCGDDGVGPAVARQVHAALGSHCSASLLELSTSTLELIEQLAGYRRAIIIDALVDEEAPLGSVRTIELTGAPAAPGLGFHTAGLGPAVALARAVGMDVPEEIAVFGIVIREPRVFTESLSEELSARLPEIVGTIREAEAVRWEGLRQDA
jgi:hydrogenase maturation protease